LILIAQNEVLVATLCFAFFLNHLCCQLHKHNLICGTSMLLQFQKVSPLQIIIFKMCY